MATTSVSTSTTLQQLQQLFPATLMLDTHTLAGVLGIAYKTLNNQAERFPIKPVKFGRRKLYRIIDVAGYIDGELGLVSSETISAELATTLLPVVKTAAVAPPRGRGRPRKMEGRAGQ